MYRSRIHGACAAHPVHAAALALVACLALVQCAREPEPQITADDGSLMVLLPAGEFQMGGMKEDLEGVPGERYINFEAERPRHSVKLSAFYIGKYEVTNAQYKEFLADIEGGGSAAFDHPDQPEKIGHGQRHVTDEMLGDNQPAVGLSWYDAFSYCRWSGGRLPTEAEWEYAARGPGEEYRKYPWGNEAPDADGIWWANYRPDSGTDRDGYRYAAPVGSFPDGISPFGIMDLAGNAVEWVQDWYSIGYYRSSDGAQDPPGPAQGTKRVSKGGSYGSEAHHIRVAGRFWGKPHVKGPRLGFRCAQSID